MSEFIYDILLQELEAWAELGLKAQLWWRDDDAAEPTDELEKLIALSRRYHIPVNIAVIPAKAGQALVRAIDDTVPVWVLQHGFNHVNYAEKGKGAWELGLDRPVLDVMTKLSDGRTRLESLFPERFVPVVVPPWNHVAPKLLSYFRINGFRGFSVEDGRIPERIPDDLTMINVHVDLLRWKGGPAAFRGTEKVLKELAEVLEAMRTAKRPMEPVGILTHHLEMTPRAWAFLDGLFAALKGNGSVQWMGAPELWPETEA